MKTFSEKKIFLFGGSGGVGKTTLSASFGLSLARQGSKTLVVTVDPAKKLAQALGIEKLEHKVQEIPLPKEWKSSGSLYASMLDSKRYFDHIITRFAKSKEQEEKILNHPLYRITVDNLGGSHEYAAMEQLIEFSRDPRFEKIVVDTPPTQNAVDLFSAPERLSEFLDQSVLSWFINQKNPIQRFFQSGTRFTIQILQKLLGGSFFSLFESFLSSLSGMEAGFIERSKEVNRLLSDSKTTFLLVGSACETRLLEAKCFLETIKEKNISLSAIILNRIDESKNIPVLPISEISSSHQEILFYFSNRIKIQEYWIAKFKQAFPKVFICLVEQKEVEPHTFSDLIQLGDLILENINSKG